MPGKRITGISPAATMLKVTAEQLRLVLRMPDRICPKDPPYLSWEYAQKLSNLYGDFFRKFWRGISVFRTI